MTVYNILWDTDDIENKEELDLPDDIYVPDNMSEDEISDLLTEMTGYCHKGFSVVA